MPSASKDPATEQVSASRRMGTVTEAAAYAAVSPRTIQRRIADGTIKGYRFGPKLLRLDLAEIDRVLRPVHSNGTQHA